MNSLGIYFSPSVINLVETKGKKILNSIEIPASAYSNIALEDKVPEELKIVALFKDELRKNKILAKEATICLSAADLIVRTFDIPILPPSEINNAINFEAKKYLPFKIEDLYTNYQIQLDKVNRKNFVLFIGIKKEILEKYISILRQLDIKITSLEFSAFSILRFVEMSGIREKGVMGVIGMDSKNELSVDFSVIENGFPLFARDINLSLGTLGSVDPKANMGMLAEKLKTEIRVSVDYYNRKFPGKRIEQLLLIDNSDFANIVETFATDLKFEFKYVDPSKFSSRQGSASFLKAFSVALSGIVKTPVKVNIISTWERTKQLKEGAQNPADIIPLLFADLKIDPKVIIIAALVASSGLGLGLMQKMPLNKEINSIISSRPSIPNINPDANYEELIQAQTQYEENIKVMDSILKEQLYLTPQLSAIPSLLPESAWLEKMTFKIDEDKSFFEIAGKIYMGDNAKELQLINDMSLEFQKNPQLAKYFKDIKITSVSTEKLNDYSVTSFIIKGNN